MTPEQQRLRIDSLKSQWAETKTALDQHWRKRESALTEAREVESKWLTLHERLAQLEREIREYEKQIDQTDKS